MEWFVLEVLKNWLDNIRQNVGHRMDPPQGLGDGIAPLLRLLTE